MYSLILCGIDIYSSAWIFSSLQSVLVLTALSLVLLESEEGNFVAQIELLEYIHK